MRRVCAAVVLLALSSSVMDCSSKASVRNAECTPGEQRPCDCSDGRNGTQECGPSGSTYSQCSCGYQDAAVDSAEAGGSGASGGTAGGGGSSNGGAAGDASAGSAGVGGSGGDGGASGSGGTGGVSGTGGTTGGTGGMSGTGGTGGTSTGGSGGTAAEDPNVCPGETFVLAGASATITRSLVGTTNDYSESCGGLEEAVFRVVAPLTGTMTVTVDPLSSWGAALVVRAGSCTGAEIDCRTGGANVPVTMTFNASAGTEYFIFPARFSGAFGNYTLMVSQ